MAGVVAGLLEVALAISFGALIFSGDLSQYLAHGIGLGLAGGAITGGVVALFCTVPGTIGGNQDTPAAIMAVVAAGIAAALSGSTSGESSFSTVAVAIALATSLTGLFFLLLGSFELGNLVRFLPYPVVGGFLAGTGWLLVSGAIGLMADLSPEWSQFELLFRPGTILLWLPGLLFAAALIFVVERFDQALILPGMIVGAILLFYVVAWVSGVNGQELSSRGLLMGPFPEGGLWPRWAWTEIGRVDWAAIGSQLPNIGALILLSAVALLLNATGLEVVTKRDTSLDRELRSAGLANLVSGAVGGYVGYQQLSVSALGIRLGAGARLVGIFTSAICLLALTAGASFLELFPKMVVGGLLLFLGLEFLKEWVYDAFFRLPPIEYGVILFILIVIGTAGFLQGIAVGVVAAIILFVVAYSRIEVVRHELTGEYTSSRKTRNAIQRQLLSEEGRRIYILRLQGFIFFGTADRLLNVVRDRLQQTKGSPARYVLLDFRRVTGLDSTGMLSLQKLQEVVADQGGTLFIVEASEEICHQLEKGGLATGNSLRFCHHLDEAMEWCENELLERLGHPLDPAPVPLVEQLAATLMEETNLEPLWPYLERVEAAAGEHLIVQGDEPDCLYFVETGQVTARLEYPDRRPLRLETVASGHVVGELGFYMGQKRTASVVADVPSVLYRLTIEELDRLEKEEPAVASALHRLMVHLLSYRVTHLVETVKALER
jgi:SulP family sulfate permease